MKKMRLIGSLIIMCGLLAVGVFALTQEAVTPTPGWLKYQAKTPEGQTRAAFFDDVRGTRLKPNSSKIVGAEDAPVGPSLPYGSFLRQQVCAADLVITGAPTGQESFLTPHETQIFTDYTVVVGAVFRGHALAPRDQNTQTIVVSLRGGKIDTDAGPIEVETGATLFLNQRYILFLRRIPMTSSYSVSGPVLTAASVATAQKVTHSIPEPLAHGDKSAATVSADIREVAAKCEKKGGAQ